MDDISRQVGISKKTLYEIFKHKDELVVAVIQYVIEDNTCQMVNTGVIGKNAIEHNLHMMVYLDRFVGGMNPVCFIDLQRYYPEAYQLLTRHRTHFVEQSILQNLKQGIEEGLYRPNIDVAIIARYRTESVFLIFQQQWFSNLEMDAARVNTQIFIHYLYGLCTLKGHEVLSELTKIFFSHKP